MKFTLTILATLFAVAMAAPTDQSLDAENTTPCLYKPGMFIDSQL
jgi:hypothetical protein